jgi:hypothetical protein
LHDKKVQHHDAEQRRHDQDQAANDIGQHGGMLAVSITSASLHIVVIFKLIMIFLEVVPSRLSRCCYTHC